MRDQPPIPITAAEHRARWRRVRRIARQLGFAGRVEYRHVYSGTGGAQFGLGTAPDRDLLVVFAEAFERDANPDDFSLAAIVAHERGHQLMCRDERFQRLLGGRISGATEEILASLVGSVVVPDPVDRQALVFKALAETIQCGVNPTDAERLVTELRSYLEKMR